MKKTYYILIAFFVFSNLIAQNSSILKKANKEFQRKAYIKAASLYEQIQDPSKEVLKNLGDCYYYNFQMANAVKAYDKLFSTSKDTVSKEIYFKYANALKGIKNYDKGDEMMTKYTGIVQKTTKFMTDVSRISPFTYTFNKLSKTNESGDFGISFYGDKVAFSSTKDSKGENYSWNNKPFLDLFWATIDEKGQLNNIKPFPESINTKKHESSATFSADLKTMYFDRTDVDKVKIGNELVSTVKIYEAELINGKWDNAHKVSFSSDRYSVEHPCLSKDGKKLYFASDMPGSLGSLDLFVVDVKGDGTFSQPKNLGNKINTSHREQFPFIDAEGNLYFASDGHQGNGNLDIFVARKISDTEFDEPLNLGSSINSEMDDFNFIIDVANDKGYFASNRTGEDNLYSFKREENKKHFLVEGEVKDKITSEVLPGTTIKLYDDKGELLEQVVVGKDGVFNLNTEANKKYKIVASKDFYITSEQEFFSDDRKKLYINLQMQMLSYNDAEEIINKKEDGSTVVELENIYFDFNKSEIKEQAAKVLDVLVGLLKKYPEMEIEIGAHTDSRASQMYNLRLSNRRAASSLEYLVKSGIERKRLKSIGYGESKPLVKCPKNACTEEEHAKNRRCTFTILK